MIGFVDCHQDFLAHLEVNIDSLLRAPMRQCLNDEAVGDVFFYGNVSSSAEADPETIKYDGSGKVGTTRNKKLKRKGRQPVCKGGTGLAVA